MKRLWMRFTTKRWVLLCGIFALVSAMSGAEVKTTITYIGTDAIYVSAGRLQHVAVGNRADVYRAGELQAILEVRFVADNSAACRLLESRGTIRVGDDVTIHVTDVSLPDDSVAESSLPSSAATGATPSPSAERTAAKRRISGHAGAGVYWQEDRDSPESRVVEPSFSLRLRVENFPANRHTLSVRLRGRQSLRERDGSDPTRWTGRIHEVSLSYDDPLSPYHYSAGRILNSRLRGIGYFDGVLADYRASRPFVVGVFGGTEPDPRTTEIRARQTTFGAFGSFETGRAGARRFQSTLAAAGRYVNGRISREFLYEQTEVSLRSKLWLLQSAEFNLHRGWQKDANSSSLDLANLLLSARWNPRRGVAASLSYDERANYRTWETRSTPDSLFDDSRRSGWRAGVEYQPIRRVRVGAAAGLRSGASAAYDTRTLSLRGSLQNLFQRNIAISAALRTFHNSYTRGLQPSLTVSHDILPGLHVSAQVGRSSYEYRTEDRRVTTDWLRLQSDVYLARRLYASLSAETHFGDESSLYSVAVESGIRF